MAGCNLATMCYSAIVEAEYSKFRRLFGAVMDLDTYVRTYWIEKGKDPYRRHGSLEPQSVTSSSMARLSLPR